MPFRVTLTQVAEAQLRVLEADPGQEKRLKAVRKCLGLLERDPRHPGLNSHKFQRLSTREREVFEAYAENKTPAALRVFWFYGPGNGEITVLAITPHP